MSNKVPTAIKKARGTLRNDRTNKKEPVGKVVHPKAPKHLDKIGRDFFNRQAAQLSEMSVLTAVDIEILEMASSDYSIYRACLNRIEEEGGIIEYLTDATSSQNIPMVTAMFRSQEMYLKHSHRLGLDPVSRSNLVVEPKEDPKVDPVANMIRRVK